ncbi:DUF4625 domain-containing protein [Carboxylicivirga sp. RSCT41]|uniref:DUF4625 domain-containing protein n=1 Tax=Carboxylicivirga agarovorans TaxID=3417570 RepID=UPI003D333480
MTYKIKYYAIACWLAIIGISCSDEDSPADEAPAAVIELPTEGQLYQRGSTIMLTAEFEAKPGLKECTAYLKEAQSLKGWDDPWTPEHTIALNGADHDRIENQWVFEPYIPFDIKSGDYIFTLLVVDTELNYTSYEIPVTIE